MTVAEKWEALHAIWSDLAQNPGEIPVPDWHKPVLESRLALIAVSSTAIAALVVLTQAPSASALDSYLTSPETVPASGTFSFTTRFIALAQAFSLFRMMNL